MIDRSWWLQPLGYLGSNVGPQLLLSAARKNMDDQSIKSDDNWVLSASKQAKDRDTLHVSGLIQHQMR
jgi:hypothetical protein